MTQSVFAVQNLEKTYENGVQAVRGISFTLQKREVLGFLGPNGAGKTTTIKILLGVEPASSGEIFFHGKALRENYDLLRKIVGYVPQEYAFYSHLTVYENARLIAKSYHIKNYKERIREVFSLLELSSLKNRRSSQLSGGQKRRLNIALGILHAPKVLLLDEPSAGMDPQSRNILWQSVKHLVDTQGTSIILTTHLMEIAERLSDRVIIMDHGKILAHGTPEDLRQKYMPYLILRIEFSRGTSSTSIKTFSRQVRELIPSVKTEDHVVILRTNMGFEVTNQLNQLIIENNLHSNIKAFQFQHASLEDVFLELTGKALRE